MARQKEKSNIIIREATRTDIPAMVALNRAAYPNMAADNVVWEERHLLSHLRVFPLG